MIRILIADDQALYREGLAEIIGHWPEFHVVGQAGNGEEAVLLCKRKNPDIVLMDVRMPVMDGIEAAAKISKANPSIAIIMLTVDVDEENVFEAFRNGAKGYLLKDMPSRQLRDMLQGIARGEGAVSGAIASILINWLSYIPDDRVGCGRAELPSNGVSDRDRQLFRLVAKGLSNEEIASELYLSPGTVKKQLRALMQKYQLANRVQIAVYATKEGIAD